MCKPGFSRWQINKFMGWLWAIVVFSRIFLLSSFNLTFFLISVQSKQFWDCGEPNRPIVFNKQLCKQKKLAQPTQIVYADATPWQIGIFILHKEGLFDQSIPQSQAELLAAAYAAQVAKCGGELRIDPTWIAPLLLQLFFLIGKKEPDYKIRSKRMERGRFLLPNRRSSRPFNKTTC